MTPRRLLLSILLFPLWLAGCASGAPAAIHVAAPLGPAGGELRVLAPPASAGDGPFPVVYFLHDLWGSDRILWRQGVAQRLAARMASGDLPPFLLVAPEGDRGFWCDSWDGARRYETWLAEGLPAAVQARYRVLAGRVGRAYVGISMGGLGAVRQGLRHPSETGAMASISGLLIPLERKLVDDANFFVRPAMSRVFGPGVETLQRNDPVLLLDGVEALAPSERPALLVLGGQSDKYGLGEAGEAYAKLAREKGLVVESHLEAGGHDWSYWRDAAERAIAWAARTLAAERDGATAAGAVR
jgi:putative tributyrin esterase